MKLQQHILHLQATRTTVDTTDVNHYCLQLQRIISRTNQNLTCISNISCLYFTPVLRLCCWTTEGYTAHQKTHHIKRT